MAWGTPEHEATEYNTAGKVLVSGQPVGAMDMDTALHVINNWRSSHYHPLNTFQLRLRRMALRVDGNSLVAQRIKRLFSIKHKLERFPTMRLTQIQDIGGCRAIVSTVDHLDKLVSIMSLKDKERSGRGLKHKLIDYKDYVRNPKPSGYRGVHLVFRYHSDKITIYDGLKIEIQFRTYLQHAWATAVETVGIFIGQALKSSIGQEDWLRFFALASSAMAAYEGTAPVSGMPTNPDDLRAEIRKLYKDLEVENHLRAYNRAMNVLDVKEMSDAHYYLLELNTSANTVKVRSYKNNQLERASTDYLEIEKHSSTDAVLVRADSMAALKKAYPNYFVDTEYFIQALNRIVA